MQNCVLRFFKVYQFWKIRLCWFIIKNADFYLYFEINRAFSKIIENYIIYICCHSLNDFFSPTCTGVSSYFKQAGFADDKDSSLIFLEIPLIEKAKKMYKMTHYFAKMSNIYIFVYGVKNCFNWIIMISWLAIWSINVIENSIIENVTCEILIQIL